MPLFDYEATNSSGKRIKGVQEAATRDELASILHDQGLVIISIDERLSLGLKQLLSIQIGGLPLREKVIFAKQLSTMLSAGLPLIQALDTLVKQAKNDSFRSKLVSVYKAVEAGSSLSEAFSRDASVFNELQINLIKAGEKSGKLNEIMIRIATDLEKSKKLRSKIMGAMIYPIIIFVVMVVVFVVMMVFMIPAVKDLYADFGVTELPFITQLLVDMSGTVTSPVGFTTIVLVVVFVVAGSRYYYTTESGRRNVDKLWLKFPVFGNLNQEIEVARFSRLLALLLKSGVPIIEALRVIAGAMGNTIYRELIITSAAEVAKGNSISIPLAKSPFFPLIMLKMIVTGEQTGKLDQIMEEMAAFYDEEIDEITSNLTRLMEPFILLIVGGLVAFLAIAIYLPLYSLGQYIQ